MLSVLLSDGRTETETLSDLPPPPPTLQVKNNDNPSGLPLILIRAENPCNHRTEEVGKD